MKPILGMFLVLACLPGAAWSADEKAMAVIDKAIKAMGGQEKLEKAQTTYSAFTYKVFSGGNAVSGSGFGRLTIQGLENRRHVIEGDLNGTTSKSIMILNGDQGWTQIGARAREMPPLVIALRKQANMPELLAARPNLLKSSGFDVEWAGKQNVGDRPAFVLKVTGQDAKSLKIFYDKERGFPIKTEVRPVVPEGEPTRDLIFGDHKLEWIYSDYKDFDGIKVATKAEHKKDGERIYVQEITEFKILDKVPTDTFTEPK
jgi:hypothetical protein